MNLEFVVKDRQGSSITSAHPEEPKQQARGRLSNQDVLVSDTVSVSSVYPASDTVIIRPVRKASVETEASDCGKGVELTAKVFREVQSSQPVRRSAAVFTSLPKGDWILEKQNAYRKKEREKNQRALNSLPQDRIVSVDPSNSLFPGKWCIFKESGSLQLVYKTKNGDDIYKQTIYVTNVPLKDTIKQCVERWEANLMPGQFRCKINKRQPDTATIEYRLKDEEIHTVNVRIDELVETYRCIEAEVKALDEKHEAHPHEIQQGEMRYHFSEGDPTMIYMTYRRYGSRVGSCKSKRVSISEVENALGKIWKEIECSLVSSDWLKNQARSENFFELLKIKSSNPEEIKHALEKLKNNQVRYRNSTTDQGCTVVHLGALCVKKGMMPENSLNKILKKCLRMTGDPLFGVLHSLELGRAPCETLGEIQLLEAELGVGQVRFIPDPADAEQAIIYFRNTEGKIEKREGVAREDVLFQISLIQERIKPKK